MNIFLEIAIGGIIGTLIHTTVKIVGINKRLNTSSYKEVITEYWKTDWALALLSLLVVMTVTFIADEWLDLKLSNIADAPTTFSGLLQEKISQFAKTLAVVVGYCADSAVNAFLGGTERKLIKKAKDDGYEMEEIIKQNKPNE